MIPDTFVQSGTWTNLYTATGIATGKRLVIVNKSATSVLIWEGNSAPGIVGGDDHHGYPLRPLADPYVTSDGTIGCWVLYGQLGFSDAGRVCVQEFTQ